MIIAFVLFICVYLMIGGIIAYVTYSDEELVMQLERLRLEAIADPKKDKYGVAKWNVVNYHRLVVCVIILLWILGLYKYCDGSE